MKKNVPNCLIIVPSLTPDGPIKGAIALANGLSELGVNVSFVALKAGHGANSFISPDIAVHDLAYSSSISLLKMRDKVLGILTQLRSHSSESVVVISMCFSADLVNVLLPSYIKKVVSIRADLKENYTMDYGFLGGLLASFHYWLLRFPDLVVAMNHEMKGLLGNYKCRRIVMIPNFLNEVDFKSNELCRSLGTGIKIAFVGSLTSRKKPLLLLETVHKLNQEGFDLSLFFIGDGPLKAELSERVKQIGSDRIHLLGFQESPSEIVRNCNVMVLPSLSEGTPRAVMESLYVGTPCVIRNLSTNDNLIIDGVNGCLFDNDEELGAAILRALSIAHGAGASDSLLDESFSQTICSKKYLQAIEKL